MKAIIFDLGGVLFTNGTKRFIRYMSERFGIEESVIREIMDGKIGSDYREAKITKSEFWKQLLKALNIQADIGELEDIWINGYELLTGTRDVIFELRKKYKIYFLSDNVRERVERVNKKYNFIQWFEDGVFSHEVGIRKPHPKIYEIVLQKANVKPEEAVFIDDKPLFLIPARKLGMKTILFKNPDQFRQDLINLNLLAIK